MEDWTLKKDRIASYYEELVSRYGYDPRACDYGRAESQHIKFKVLSEAVPLDHKSVLDVGCGFADFADFLQARFAGVSYAGVDLTPAMVKAAKERRPDLSIEEIDILQADPSGAFDLVTANGIFYLLGADAAELMRRLIARMFSLCGEAVAFNSLSSACPDPQPGEFYADPDATFAYCRTLTPYVSLRQDYHPRDFTVYMYRTARPTR